LAAQYRNLVPQRQHLGDPGNEPFISTRRAAKVKSFREELHALRMIFLVNERAMFEFVVTETGLLEIGGRNDARYTQ
jgi:hypothetical protein